MHAVASRAQEVVAPFIDGLRDGAERLVVAHAGFQYAPRFRRVAERAKPQLGRSQYGLQSLAADSLLKFRINAGASLICEVRAQVIAVR